MTLRELITYLPKAVASGNLDHEATGVTADSRQVKPGSVFVAIKGTDSDGHKFISTAVEKGAVAIIASIAPDERWPDSVAWVHSSDTRDALGRVASALHNDPSATLKVAGITGTNGKTTTAFLLHHIMKDAWTRAGLLGTIKNSDGVNERAATLTTASPDVIQRQLGKMVENGCRGVVMEVSSHGIHQKRVDSIKFDVAIFTNLTQDHLDYHLTMDAYFNAKKALFESLQFQEGKKKPMAVVNLDDRYGEKLVKELGEQINIVTYGQGAHCDFKVTKIRQQVRGTEFQLDNRGKSYLVRTPLIGRFNVYNCLAAIAGAAAVGIKPRDAVKSLEAILQVPGRLEQVGTRGGVTVFVDYAHTPDALKNVCSTVKGLTANRLITVFGCGGDRDQLKRPLMAEVASEISDICVITSDNPRSEDPEEIIRQIAAGMKNKSYSSVVDREEAIIGAINAAEKGDVVLIAGKGHETYQQLSDKMIQFDDRKVANFALRDKELPVEEEKPFRKKFDDGDNKFNNFTRKDNDDYQKREFRSGSRDNDRGEFRKERRDSDDRGSKYER